MAARDGVRDLGPRRIEHRDEPEQAEPALGLLAALWRRRIDGEPAARDAEHAQAAARVARDATLDLLALRRAQGSLLAVPADDRRAERQERLGRALGVHPQASVALVDRRHELEHRVEVELRHVGEPLAGPR